MSKRYVPDRILYIIGGAVELLGLAIIIGVPLALWVVTP